ncbi:MULTISPECIES: DDE-type integrase/transposase/recombinase [unclassified Sulfitobacter]|uniref:DDE-type integrase/transposase/recombinase n=1 Tax=unclassified Sulfitobacter TaxID=196795 RepID=UPI0023E08FC9|nr:DDE-type integrase/transposase/recombinase [Sulfitobacter sp. Ks41]
MKTSGRSYWHWRAVVQHGFFIEDILQSRRNICAAKRFLIRLIECWGFVSKRIMADKQAALLRGDGTRGRTWP